MEPLSEAGLIRQHLIDPEVCIRCNTCEATCPIGAITHDDRNYVVRADVCNGCMACIAPCPTGSIDHWRTVPRERAYTVEEQFGWDELPAEVSAEPPSGTVAAIAAAAAVSSPLAVVAAVPDDAFKASGWGSTSPPWSAAHPYTQLYGPRAERPSVMAVVTGNSRVTQAGSDDDTHHIVLDFGREPFPVLEGQSIGIIPPGLDAQGRAHHPRQYSVSSPRDGERPGANSLALTVKRVLEDREGRPLRGVASNHLCDLKPGDRVEVTGPFGATFLMPDHPGAHLVMICTGTGSAPMRAMTERRRRLKARTEPAAPAVAPSAAPAAGAATADAGRGDTAWLSGGAQTFGRLMLFFGARTPEALPYLGPLKNLAPDLIDIHLAFSRVPGQPRRHVQDLMREQSASLLALLRDPETHFYVCGLRSMEEGVVGALRDIAEAGGLSWETLGASLRQQGRLHLETY